MRIIDRQECEAFGHTPKQALRRGIIDSDWSITALVNGRPEAMMGVVTVSAIEGLGRPWMLGTDAVYAHGRDLLSIGPQIVAHMLDSIRRGENLVSAANSRAIRLLERWGFTVEEQHHVIGGVPFREFWIER